MVGTSNQSDPEIPIDTLEVHLLPQTESSFTSSAGCVRRHGENEPGTSLGAELCATPGSSTSHSFSHRIHGAGIYANIKGVY